MASKGHQVVTTRGWIDIPVSRILPAEWNYKGEDEALSVKLRANLKKNGQVESVIVRVHPKRAGFYEMVNGNHRLPEFKAANITTVHAFNLGKVSQAVAARVAIETNDTRFQNDPVKLARVLKQLQAHFDVAELEHTLPFTTNELENYASLLDFKWEDLDRGSTPPEEADEQDHVRIDLSPDQRALWDQCTAKGAEKGHGDASSVLESLMRHALSGKWPK